MKLRIVYSPDGWRNQAKKNINSISQSGAPLKIVSLHLKISKMAREFSSGGRGKGRGTSKKSDKGKSGWVKPDGTPLRARKGDYFPDKEINDRKKPRPFTSRDGDSRPRRDENAGERKPYARRDESSTDRKPFVRRDDDRGERKPYARRDDNSSTDRKPFVRRDDDRGERKPYARRDDSSTDRKPFVKT